MAKLNTFIRVGSLFLAVTSAAHAALFFTDTSIGTTDTNYDGQDIIVIGCTLTVDGSHHFSDLLIIENGMVTCSPVDTNNAGGLSLSISNNLIIEAGSSINVQGLGSGPGLGLGAGATVKATNSRYGFYFFSGGGGAYGGNGGSSFGGAPGGGAFGQPAAPTYSGSGGGAGIASGGAGGGLVNLNIGEALVVDGAINANGGNGVNLASGAGSGGGISITAPSISGTGSISACGGTAEGLDGGGGGGGRIALWFTTNDFTGSVSAAGGPGAVTGGAGTVVLRGATGANQFLVDNGGLSGTNTPLTLPPGSSLSISGGAVAYFPVETLLTSLVVESNSWLAAGPVAENMGHSLTLTVQSNAIIQTGGGISFDSAGYAGGLGPNAGASSITNSVATGGGGGNGGYGGTSAFGAIGGGAGTIPPVNDPAAMGSGGGAGSGQEAQNLGGAGGGSVFLQVEGSLTVNGLISANGASGVVQGSGGGAGGGVVVSAQSFSGNGTISANGGAGQLPDGGGGGGGFIAILVHSSNQFSGSLSAYGGLGAMAGGAGVVTEAISNGPAVQIILDNGGLSGANTPAPSIEGEYDLNILGGAIMALKPNFIMLGTPRNLLVGSNSFITINGIGNTLLNLSSNLTIAPTGGVVVDGLGEPSGEGDEHGETANDDGGGGGNGGGGGTGAGGALGGGTSGSITAPEGVASGGGGAGELGFDDRPNSGGSGGGWVQIHAGATLSLGGVISANGGAGQLPGGGGGAGGNIWLTVAALTGAGSISANGGAGQRPGGGGGGGRIAVIGSTSLFTGSMSAYGGTGYSDGGAGTIYISPVFESLQSEVIVDNGGLSNTYTSLQGLQSVSNLTIRGGAVVTSPPELIGNLLIASNGILLPTNIAISVQGDATVQAGGSILLDGTANLAGSGAGSNTISPGGSLAGSGGGHGGLGGGSETGAFGGKSYDQFNSPEEEGSSGGPGAFSEVPGAPGGGALQLRVTGTLQVDGLISANGAAASKESGGGGSGGSVWLTAGVMAGAGVISADGGAGHLPDGGGGGGGRIALRFGTGNFTGSCQAAGGAGFIAGGAGTIYLGSQNQGSPGASNQLIIDNGGWFGAATPIPFSPAFGLTATGGAVVALQTSGPEIMLDNLTVSSNAVITAASAPGELFLTVLGDAQVGSNSAVTLDGLGYNAGNPGPGAGEVATNNEGSGGGYGGAGGQSAGSAQGGAIYGSAQQPTSFGSEGGVAFTGDSSLSQGGGAVNLAVLGTLTLNGKVSANGNAGLFPGAGGGSGGSVLLSVGNLTGQGLISANGGAGQGNLGGGGGGGRIAIYARTNTFDGAITASGGTGFASGQSGTVYISTNGSFLVFPPSVVIVPGAETNNSSLKLQWTGSGGVSYQAEFSRDLTHWQLYGSPIVSSNGLNVLVLPIGSDAGTFFRLVLTQ